MLDIIFNFCCHSQYTSITLIEKYVFSFCIAKHCVVDEKHVLYVEVTKRAKQKSCCYCQPNFRAEQEKKYSQQNTADLFPPLKNRCVVINHTLINCMLPAPHRKGTDTFITYIKARSRVLAVAFLWFFALPSWMEKQGPSWEVPRSQKHHWDTKPRLSCRGLRTAHCT